VLAELAKTNRYSEENVFTYPSNMGITGYACANKKSIVSNKGQNDSHFAPEVDNFSAAGNIKNLIIGPMIDTNGEVRGVVQLFNKLSFGCKDETAEIVQRDKDELDCILLALGEVIKTADQFYEFEK